MAMLLNVRNKKKVNLRFDSGCYKVPLDKGLLYRLVASNQLEKCLKNKGKENWLILLSVKCHFNFKKLM